MMPRNKDKKRPLKFKLPITLPEIQSRAEEEIRKLAKDAIPGPIKMNKAVDRLADWMDDLIVLPPWLEPFDGPAIKFFLNILVQDVYERIEDGLRKE